MIKVAYIVPLLAPYADIRYQELAKNPKIEVHVIVELDTYYTRKEWKFHDIEGVYTHLIDKRISKKFIMKNKKDGYIMEKGRDFSISLKSKIRQINPDIVLACNSTQIMLLGRFRKYKLGVIVEDTLRAEESRNFLNRIMKRIMLKRADFYCPFSKDAVAFLNSNGIYKPFIKSSWSMERDFFNDLSEEEIVVKKKEFGMNKRINYVLVASLIPRKGVIQFINAWSKLPQKFMLESELFILGDGVQKEEIEYIIKERKLTNVHLEGNKEYKIVSHYLQCGDIFVLPTLEDLCSLAVLEAMASKKPVLTTVYNGAREFVEDDVNGYVFDPLDELDIIRTLKKVFFADLNKMSMESEKKIKKYSTKNVMGKFGEDLIAFFEEGKIIEKNN